MNKVKYKLNREWLNELLKHKTNSNVYFSLSDNDIRILLTYIDVLQSKIDKAIKKLEYYNSGEALYYVPIQDIIDILKED